MRIAEILNEGRMGEIDDLIKRVRELPSAVLTFDDKTHNIWLDFFLDDIKGTLRMKIRKNPYNAELKTRVTLDYDQRLRAFEDKLLSVVRSQRRGLALPLGKRDQIAKKFLMQNPRIGNNAIKILTNIDIWEVVSILHGDFEHPRGGYHRGTVMHKSMMNRDNPSQENPGVMTSLKKAYDSEDI